MIKIMKGYKIFHFTPSGKSLKKTLWECLKNFEIILQFLTTLYVLARTKSATKYIILWKVNFTSFKMSISLFIF